mmetsp:Transcript_4470/g.14006  ORF Transcript_4470/g.14006 Transcript_4470/m.14006 type:complete len:115 (+) Transcript_4470:1092-1436(+)
MDVAVAENDPAAQAAQFVDGVRPAGVGRHDSDESDDEREFDPREQAAHFGQRIRNFRIGSQSLVLVSTLEQTTSRRFLPSLSGPYGLPDGAQAASKTQLTFGRATFFPKKRSRN